MTAQERSSIRAVVFQPNRISSSQLPAGTTPTTRLLDDLGHDVNPAFSAQDALNLLDSEPTDLLVFDATSAQDNEELVSHLSSMPMEKRPREIAIFSEWFDHRLESLRSRLGPAHVHVFLKPLHMHGLLNVLRQLDADSQMPVV